MINIRKLLEQGHQARQDQKNTKEADIEPSYRVGSVGCVTEDGKVYGTCHRIAHLRDLGVEEEPDLSTRIMWDGGFGNEDYWVKTLQAAEDVEVVDKGRLRVEIEGVDQPVVGHPDLELREIKQSPVDGLSYAPGYDVKNEMVIELKGIYGYTTFTSVFFHDRPKNENAIQCATYGMFRETDFTLAYTCASWMKLQPWDKKKWDGKFGSVPPFYKIFEMQWNGEQLQYRPEGSEEWTDTVVTKEGIKDYYRLLTEMKEKKELGPRVTGHYIDGTEHRFGEHSQCGLCPFKHACEGYDQDRDYDTWLEKCEELV